MSPYRQVYYLKIKKKCFRFLNAQIAFSSFSDVIVGKTRQIILGFVSLGCPKNVVASEWTPAEIAQTGFAITTKSDDVDVVVINTCGFITPAKNGRMQEKGPLH